MVTGLLTKPCQPLKAGLWLHYFHLYNVLVNTVLLVVSATGGEAFDQMARNAVINGRKSLFCRFTSNSSHM